MEPATFSSELDGFVMAVVGRRLVTHGPRNNLPTIIFVIFDSLAEALELREKESKCYINYKS
jgi:hypothetical protein